MNEALAACFRSYADAHLESGVPYVERPADTWFHDLIQPFLVPLDPYLLLEIGAEFCGRLVAWVWSSLLFLLVAVCIVGRMCPYSQTSWLKRVRNNK